MESPRDDAPDSLPPPSSGFGEARRAVIFVCQAIEKADSLVRAYGRENTLHAMTMAELKKLLADHEEYLGAVCVALEWREGELDTKALLQWLREHHAKVPRLVYAKYADVPRAISLGLKDSVPSILALDGNAEKAAEIIMRTVHGKRMTHYEVTEQQVSTLDAEMLFAPQVVRLLKNTAEAIGGIPGVVIRNKPAGGDRHVEFVVPMNSAFDRLRCQLPMWWHWPLKERHQSSSRIDNPVVKMFAELGARQEIFVRKARNPATAPDEPSVEEYLYCAIMPWRKRKRATVLVGILTRSPTKQHDDWLELCHQRALRSVGEYYLPRLSKTPDAALKVRYTQEYDWVITDAYAGPDRRREPTTFVNRHMFVGQRRDIPENVRELAGGFVDRMPRWVLASVVAYLALSLVDTVLTWVMVSSGKVVEMNPLLRPLVGKRAVEYILVKNGLSLSSIFVVARFHLFGLGRVVLPFNVAMYVALDLYWVWLLSRVAGH